MLGEDGSEVYTIGNPGFGATPRQPHDVDRRLARAEGASATTTASSSGSRGRRTNLYYNVSYTYSRLYGNWAGLANSDENGRSDPNVSRAFDLSPGNFDANGPERLRPSRDGSSAHVEAVRQLLARLEAGCDEHRRLADRLQRHAAQLGDHASSCRCSTTAVATSAARTCFTQTDLLLSHGVPSGTARAGSSVEATSMNLFNQDCGDQRHHAATTATAT